MILFLVLLLGPRVLHAYGRNLPGRLPGFAHLLDRPQIVGGFVNWLGGRSYLKGEFRGRKVVILLQRKRGRHDPPGRLVISLETGAAAAMEPLDFAGYRPDRGTELALFALEAKHELRLSHQDGCLKALWQPIGFFIFPGQFERPKWQSVLEAMHTLADSVARREA